MPTTLDSDLAGLLGGVSPEVAWEHLTAAEQAEIARHLVDIENARDFEAAPKWFHSYQREAWDKTESTVIICAGWQSGKTVSLSPWLIREIHRRGPGDYGAFSSTYKLLLNKFLPDLKKNLKGLAEFRAGDQQFVFTAEGSRLIHGAKWNGEPTIIQLGHAQNPDSLESATLKAVAWDECGQRLVPQQSFNTVKSRLMVNRGRMILASKPYEFNWFQKLVANKGAGVAVVSFPSWANPENPPQSDTVYWDDIKSDMPAWRFDMQYGGIFTKPAGLIYDSFIDDYWPNGHKVAAGPIPPEWSRYVGLDFGGVNTCAGFYAAQEEDGELTGRYILYRTYLAGNKTSREHVEAILDGEPRIPLCVGGTKFGSEEQWRREFSQAGLFVHPPTVNGVDVGIQTIWSAHAEGRILVSDDMVEYLDQKGEYSREVDESGEVIPGTIANKSKYHYLDQERYIGSRIFKAAA